MEKLTRIIIGLADLPSEIVLQERETVKSLSPVGQLYLSAIPDEIKVNDEQICLSDDKMIECGGTARISIRDGDQ